MIRKIVLATFTFGVFILPAFAQQSHFKRKKAEPARQEREYKLNSNGSRLEKTKPKYGSDILRVSPLSALDIGVGFGLSYEKLFGKEQMIGLVLPLSIMLEENNNFYSYYGNSRRYNTYLYFNPGIKIYPFGQRKVTYAVGPSLMFGYGGGKQESFNSPGGYQGSADLRKIRMGIMANNYVNFNISPKFNFGIEAGIGIRYIDRETYSSPGNRTTFLNGINPTGQFSMTLGYRF